MKKTRVLTGITTTGTPHLGNYIGAIKPAIQASHSPDLDSFFFLADYHALIKTTDRNLIHQSTKEVAACWIALGLNTETAIFYRQSDIPEIPELSWFLSCIGAKGLMNRAHAYKNSVQNNLANKEDSDYGITMGLFSYPILMAADILMFNATVIPVGRDQIQHVEMARDIAQRFNHLYGNLFDLPKAQIDENIETIQGLDGKKMSKSYNNIIPIFLSEKKLKKHINKIKTNLLEPGETKDPKTSTVFQIWKSFATDEQTKEMEENYKNGIAWGEAKKLLFDLINSKLKEPRETYNELLAKPGQIEEILSEGGKKARAKSRPFMEQIREAVGIKALKEN
tara:strand:+ start:427 stop:1440 length:1014 start_codon:yes stop_codon:yes gene_type:complete